LRADDGAHKKPPKSKLKQQYNMASEAVKSAREISTGTLSVTGKAKIFLCYAKEDKAQVEHLYQKFKDAGFEPWMDKVDLAGGEKWRPTIKKAIRESHFFVACVSSHWVQTDLRDRKRFFRREIQTALDVLPELAQGDIYIIPARLEDCEVPESLSLFQWVNYFQPEGLDKLIQSIHKGMDRFGIMKPLRCTPARLSPKGVTLMLRERNFYDRNMNNVGKGIKHEYERRGDVVIDRATGLTWQRSGSTDPMRLAGAKKYIKKLNNQKLGGYNDWRLPTLEEAMSLVEPKVRSNRLYIDPVFVEKDKWIGTADQGAGAAWCIFFNYGGCYYDLMEHDGSYVRAVRSG